MIVEINGVDFQTAMTTTNENGMDVVKIRAENQINSFTYLRTFSAGSLEEINRAWDTAVSELSAIVDVWKEK